MTDFAIMQSFAKPIIKIGPLLARFYRDRRAASAVEFAIVCGPFFFLLMGVLQLGIFYMAQSALDTGVNKTAETLRNNFTTGTTATLLDAASLKSSVIGNSGTMFQSASVSVEIRPLSNLSGASVPIVDSVADYGTNTATLVLRASGTVITFAPGLSGLSAVESSALIRRQGS